MPPWDRQVSRGARRGGARRHKGARPPTPRRHRYSLGIQVFSSTASLALLTVSFCRAVIE